ncbi:hypothetical protein G6010_11795, partial [Dietzia sp. SLG510A3-3B2-2]|nr:hypothetical protein [Dietzia sp. SLG510A3-3B2-2]
VAAAASLRREAEREAGRIVDAAHARADHIISVAREHADELRTLRERVLDELAAIRATLEPVPGRRRDGQYDLPEEPDLSSIDE